MPRACCAADCCQPSNAGACHAPWRGCHADNRGLGRLCSAGRGTQLLAAHGESCVVFMLHAFFCSSHLVFIWCGRGEQLSASSPASHGVVCRQSCLAAASGTWSQVANADGDRCGTATRLCKACSAIPLPVVPAPSEAFWLLAWCALQARFQVTGDVLLGYYEIPETVDIPLNTVINPSGEVCPYY